MPADGTPADPQVLLIQNDAAYRSALAHELRCRGLGVVEVPSTMRALDLLDRAPHLRFAIVAADMLPNTLNAVAFARMMTYRNPDAQIVLVIATPGDIPVLDGPDADLFAGVVVKMGDIAAASSGILFLMGFETGALRYLNA